MTKTTTSQKNAASKLTWIQERLAEGLTVYVCTYTRATKITPKTMKRWAESGIELIKVDSTGALVMARGRHYDLIDYCALRAS